MSATKRRAGAAASPDMSTPAPKRKRNDDTHFPDEETVATTSELGLKLVRQLMRSQDKSGRNVATHFLDLPSKEEYPDYYQQIAMPITLRMIEARLEDGDYETMERLEGDLKRMVQNAKDYNDSKSEVFQDAERMRKALSNFMPKHNPAYQNPEYRAVPTPIPQSLIEKMRESSVSTAGTGGLEKVKLVLKRRQSQAVSTDSEEDVREAQLALLDELSEQETAANFEKKPPKRDYPDYYKVIQRPSSISDVRIMVQQGKILDWNSLAREIRLIWDNAKEYNEPSSAIYEMTEQLEAWFEEKVQAAGAGPRAKLPKLSLSQPKRTQLKLTLGGSTPAPSLSGGTIDNESLRRQKEEMGQALSRANRGTSRIMNANISAPASTAPSMRRSLSTADPSDIPVLGVNGVPMSHSRGMQEGVRNSIPPSIRQLPTPAMDGEPPANFNGQPIVNGNRYPEMPQQTFGKNIFAESDNPIERKYRDLGKGLQDALLSSVTYATHPHLPGNPKWKLSRFASATKTQTSSFIYLPSDHFYLRLTPNLTSELRSRRNHKLCVSVNWQPVAPSQQVPGAFDFRLQPGENTIAVDVIAELKEGERKDYAPPQMQFDFERITLIAILVDRKVD